MLKKEKFNQLNQKQKRIVATVIFILLAIFCAAVAWFIGRPMLDFVATPEKFREWVGARGIWGKLIFIGMSVFQIVIAFVPGEPLETGAGYAFGAIEGTILCMTAITFGSYLVFTLVKKWGITFVEIFFSRKNLKELKFLQNNRKQNIFFFLIMFLPGTPKDLITYFAGLTDIKPSLFLGMVFIARLPSVITSTVAGSALGEENYKLAIIVACATLLISGIGLLIYKLIAKKRRKK